MNQLVSFAAALCTVAYANKFAEGSESREAMKINGPMVAAFTPFDKDGELDFTNMPKLAARLNEWGVNRIMVGGTTGESINLTKEERTAVTKEWLRLAPHHNLDIYVNIQMESVKEAKQYASEVAQLKGVKGLFAMSPSFFKPRRLQDLTNTISIIASGAPDLPFWYYHFPEKNGVAFNMYEWI